MCNILCTSGGVTNGSTVGRNYNGDDITYSKEDNFWDED